MSGLRRIILDANLLVLYVVGLTDVKLVNQHKRLKIFDVDDYRFLQQRLSSYDKIVVTPGVLTESSNLLRQTNEAASTRLMRKLKTLIDCAFVEVYHPAREAAEQDEYEKLGLTDAGLLLLGDKYTPLLTADLSLYLAYNKRKLPVENFNYVRPLRRPC